MKNLLSTACLFLLFFCFSACKNKTDLDSKGVPGKLVIACFQGESPSQTKAVLGQFAAYFKKQLGMDVELIFATDYTAVIEAIRSKKAHIAYMSPFMYIIASQSKDIQPIVILGTKGSPHMYHSLIITSSNSDIMSMDDVKKRAKNLTICFADPASTSGHLIPKGYLTTIGLDADKGAFKETMFAGSHVASMLTTKSGKVDVGCTFDFGYEKAIRMGLIKRGDLRILWTSDPIMGSPIVVRNDLNKEFVAKIQAIYLNLHKADPALFHSYTDMYYPGEKNLSYQTVQDSQYNGLRKIAAGIKDLKVAMK